MLCTIPTSRSSPNWLDRLHASKGFSIPSGLDLDHFLHSNSNPNPSTSLNPDSVDPPPYGKKLSSQKNIGFENEQRLFDVMSNVLSELFVMGDPRDSAGWRKGARKQLNPKARVPSTSAIVYGGALAMSPPSVDNSIAEAKRDRKKMKRMRENSGQAEVSNPPLYTGTDVTVIDTSSPGWKTEKHFKKGMAWKGRDKKMWNACRKKRKLGLVDKFIVEKQRVERLRPLSELEGTEHNVESQNEVCTGNVTGEAAKESDYHIQTSKRPKFLRSPRLPIKNLSLFRLHVVNKNHKSGLPALRGTLKGKF